MKRGKKRPKLQLLKQIKNDSKQEKSQFFRNLPAGALQNQGIQLVRSPQPVPKDRKTPRRSEKSCSYEDFVVAAFRSALWPNCNHWNEKIWGKQFVKYTINWKKIAGQLFMNAAFENIFIITWQKS